MGFICNIKIDQLYYRIMERQRIPEVLIVEPLELIEPAHELLVDYVEAADEARSEIALTREREEIIASNQAFLAIVLEQELSARRIAFRICQDPDLVDDIMQMYYIKLHEGKCGDLRDLSKVGNNIFGIMKRHLTAIYIDMTRKAKVRPYTSLEERVTAGKSSGTPLYETHMRSVDDLETTETIETILLFIHQVYSPTEVEFFIDFFVREFSYQELMQKYILTEGTVKTRLHRMRKRIKEEFGLHYREIL